jgi:hypothetical protein
MLFFSTGAGWRGGRTADGGRRRLTADGEQRSSAMEGGGGQQVGSVL